MKLKQKRWNSEGCGIKEYLRELKYCIPITHQNLKEDSTQHVFLIKIMKYFNIYENRIQHVHLIITE